MYTNKHVSFPSPFRVVVSLDQQEAQWYPGTTMQRIAEIAVKFAISVLTAINLFGNTLVIMAVFKHRAMQSPMNYLLANLALADMLFGIFIIPLRLLSQEFSHPEGWVGELLCKVITHGNFAWIGSTASILTLMLIAWERYHAILHPHNAGWRLTKQKLRKMLVSTWVASCIFLVPETWSLRFDAEKQSCIYDFPPWMLRLDAVLWLSLVGVLPLIFMAICYGCIVRKLWFSQKTTENESRRTLLQSRKRVTRIVLMVTIILGACWLPNLIWYCLDSFALISKVPLFHAFSQVLIMINTAVNPVIYATQDRNFRHHMWRSLRNGCKSNNLVVDSQNPYNPSVLSASKTNRTPELQRSNNQVPRHEIELNINGAKFE